MGRFHALVICPLIGRFPGLHPLHPSVHPIRHVLLFALELAGTLLQLDDTFLQRSEVPHNREHDRNSVPHNGLRVNSEKSPGKAGNCG